MLHRLCGPPSIPLSFNLAAVLPRRCAYRVSCDTEGLGPPTSSTHRLQRGLPGYLILFAPHAFAPQRHHRPRRKSFTTLRPSSLTRHCWIRLAPIVQYSPLLPPVGVWAVSQSQCG